MIKHLILCASVPLCLFGFELKENSFIEGTLTNVTTSDIAGTKWMKNPKSLKLSSQYPIFQEREWEPLPNELGKGNMVCLLQAELGDIDNDGDPDLLVSSLSPSFVGTIAIFENRGTRYNPTFRLKKTIFIPGAEDLTLGDIDSDGRLDLMVENVTNIYGYKGIGNFTWERNPAWDVTMIPVEGSLMELACDLGDLDKDGDPDLMVYAVKTTGNIGPLVLGDLLFFAYDNKNDTFTRKPEWDIPPYYNAPIGVGWNAGIQLVDLCNDGNPEVLFTVDEWGFVYLRNNTGTSSPIWSKASFPYGNKPGRKAPGDTPAPTVSLADLDFDGDYDMLKATDDG
ncbi:MAG: VCBS repeat-containing protein, partial [bacterium]